MSRTVLSMLFQASLLLTVAKAAALTESQSHRAGLLRIEKEQEGSWVVTNGIWHKASHGSISNVELMANGMERRENERQVTKEIEAQIPANDDILMTYNDKTDDIILASSPAVSDDIVMTYQQRGEDDAGEVSPTAPKQDRQTRSVEKVSNGNGIGMTYKEKVALPGLPVSDDMVMFSKKGDSEVDDVLLKLTPKSIPKDQLGKVPREAILAQPPGPCVWLLQVAHGEKGGVPKVWRTVMVNGTKDDKFYFRGCTTVGEEAGYCLTTDGSGAGVRVMRNWKGEVVEFGSCCKPNLLDTIVNSRIQHCEPPPSAEAKQVNASSWMRTVYDLTHEAPWLQQSANLTLEGLMLAGTCLMVIISSLMWCRYKKK